ncbi:hypothetical protein BT96DRAFT_867286 [Gymnopus androsaceus JB14]|uniref:DUF6535 domain-containing protein n=1 Tax=Gymnopus androsaceus JB14 TaxID=1447944 RepID=A0A6A4GPI1_9AGAR|nr:hypothetical protein BT96DRAFT_867286 [Gymnopus androsaceus JB14]
MASALHSRRSSATRNDDLEGQFYSAGAESIPSSSSATHMRSYPGITNADNVSPIQTGHPSPLMRVGTMDEHTGIRFGVGSRLASHGEGDYKQKYGPDERYKELDHDARIWHVYNDESGAFDQDMIANASGDCDVMLIFAGLFSSVLTTLLAEVTPELSPDPTKTTNMLLQTLVNQTAQISLNKQIDSVLTNKSMLGRFSITDVDASTWVNALWFISLLLSLSTALLAVLAKQWIRQYSSFISGSARERASIRQFRYDNFEKWGVNVIIGVLPLALNMSLFLFMGGLVVFVFPCHSIIGLILLIMAGSVFIAYLVISILPVFLVGCPYRTSLSDILYPIYTFLFTRSGAHRHSLPKYSRDVERMAVEDLGETEHKRMLLWLAANTVDRSAITTLAEASSAAFPLDANQRLNGIIVHELHNITSRVLLGPTTVEAELSLGRILCAAIPYTFFGPDRDRRVLVKSELRRLSTLPITTSDYAIMLSLAGSGLVSNLRWGPEDKIVDQVLKPHEVFSFVIEQCNGKEQGNLFQAPVWIWWSLCIQASQKEELN